MEEGHIRSLVIRIAERCVNLTDITQGFRQRWAYSDTATEE